jgi:hypothetical protein
MMQTTLFYTWNSKRAHQKTSLHMSKKYQTLLNSLNSRSHVFFYIYFVFGLDTLFLIESCDDVSQVSVDDLEEKITALEDYVQSVDVAAMQKI